MNKELLTQLKQYQKVRGDTKAFSNHDEFLVWADNVTPLLEFDSKISKRFEFWVGHVKSAYAMGREHHEALGESIGLLNQAIIKLELPDSTETANNKSTPLQYPDKATVKWLYHNVAWSTWAWFIGLLFLAFSLGVAFTKTPLYKSLNTQAVVTTQYVIILNKALKRDSAKNAAPLS